MSHASERKMIARRLQAARLNAGMTQEAVREALESRYGIVKTSKAAVGHWETAHAVPDMLTFRALCKMYKTSADAILFGDDGEQRPGRAIELDPAHQITYSNLSDSHRARVISSLNARIDELAEDASIDKGALDSGN